MKKKFFALLCAAVLVLGLAPAALSAAGSSDIPCFMAVNDNLLRLEDQFIPISISGQYYIPYTVLDINATEVGLDVYPIYNSITRILTIYYQDKVLIFNVNTGTCTDRGGTVYPVRVYTRNGRIYIPARFTCEQFGLSFTTYSASVTGYGPLVRIRGSNSLIGENDFLGMAILQMPLRLRTWRRTQTAASPSPSPTPTPPAAPSAPAVPTPTPDPADRSDVRTYLIFRADRTDGLDALLSQLERYQLKALFFFPAETLADYDDEVRRVLCAGHSLGLLTDGADAQTVAGQAAEGGRLLAQIAHLRSNLILAPALEDEEAWSALEQAGLLCLRPDINALPGVQARAVLEQADEYASRVSILSDASSAGASLMGQVLPALVQDRYDIRPALETEF